MRIERSTRIGTENTNKNQSASPPAHRGRTKTALRAAMCLLAWLGVTGVGFAQTVVWSENFDDGNGNNRWYADAGIWQIGSPTFGPAANSAGCRAHSCPDCATTGLTANYTGGANSRLIRIQSFAVPATNQFPRLRFWHWYSFACANCYDTSGCDYGVVEVKGTNGTWQAVSPGYYGTGGDWTYASVDLSGYAGQTVQVAFHIVYNQTGGCENTAPGWYVDDIAFETGTPVFNNPEGFEDGIGDWYAETGTWQVGVPTSGPGAAHSGTNCAATILNGNYADANGWAGSRLISAAFSVPATNQSPRLRFWHWYSFACANCYDSSGCDYGVVEVKGTNGIWQAVSPGYYGTGGGWTYASVDLSAYAGQTVQLAFHLVYGQSGCENTAPGWYVDDIALITGTPVFNNPESFENGIGDWYAETGTWQVGVPTSGPGAAYAGTNCAATILNGNYPGGANSRLVSPKLILPPAFSSPALRFWEWYSFACANCYDTSGCDYGVVEIKAGTNSWTGLYTNSGSGGVWSYPYIPLTAYGGQTVQFAFHIVYNQTGGCENTAPGWYVDDVFIQSFNQPFILTSPASQTNSVGSSATLNVSASGDLPLGYQWRFNSNSIAGATNTTLTLTNVQLSQAGYYDVVVTNDAGSVTSTPALLTVIMALTGTNINDPGEYGSLTNSSGVYTVSGAGEGTDGTADIFYFAYQILAGDAQIIARLTGMRGGDSQLAEAGIMIRETLDPGAKQVSFSVNESTNAIFRRRLTNDDFTIQNSLRGTNYLQGPNYIWLRLMRMGNTFVAHYSTNGLNWQYMWFTTVTMSNQVQVGLAVTAHHYGETNTASFDNVSLGSLTTLSGTWPLPGPQILLGGDGATAAAFQSVGGFKFLVGGVVGDYYSIKCSTNVAASLASWPLLGTVTNTYGVVPFVDTQALTNKRMFYRAQKLGGP